MTQTAPDPLGQLGACPLFEGLAATELEQVLSAGECVEVPPGAALVVQGEPGEAAFTILRGNATIEVDGTVVGDLGPGDIIGELAALDQSPRTATVRSASRVEAFRLPAEAFASLLAALPVLHERVTASLVRKLRSTTATLSSMNEETATDPPDATAAAASAADGPLTKLTAAERRVALLVAEGCSNAAIAERLFVSRHTVESHLKHAFAKLEVSSRVQLAALVLRRPGAAPPGSY